MGFRIGGLIVKNKVFFLPELARVGRTAEIYSRPGLQPLRQLRFGSSLQIARPTVTDLNTVRQYLLNEYGRKQGLTTTILRRRKEDHGSPGLEHGRQEQAECAVQPG